MSISFDSALGIHPHALSVRAERSRILAGNLANVDTPGYLAQDLDYKQILGNVAQQMSLAETPMASMAATDDMAHPLYRMPYQISRDGNTAELSIEQGLFAKNATDFETSLAFLNMKITGLSKVIEGR
jgi:flagellar basal-body rod protein FlgB